jgi:hypothetical protein
MVNAAADPNPRSTAGHGLVAYFMNPGYLARRGAPRPTMGIPYA